MLYCEVVFPVVRQTLVERRVLLLGDFARVTRPEGFSFVQLLILDGLFLDLLCLLLLARFAASSSRFSLGRMKRE